MAGLKDIFEDIEELFEHHRHEHGHGYLCVPLGPFSEADRRIAMPDILVSMTNTQKFSLGPVTEVDAAGATVPLGGPVSVTTADTTLLTISDNGDGTFEATASAGAAGTATIVVSDVVLSQNIVVTITSAVSPGVGLNVPVGVPVAQ